MKIACIGGGTGTTAVLKGLKDYSDLELSVIVTMMDDGGSNAIVRDEFGILPLSDVRKSILALASGNKNEILRQLFTYRFAKGNGISGHTLGNLIMIALTDITGSEKEAIQESANIFSVKGKIIPVT
ncbi:MAG TPA: gluconeogenesis factor YvcK family protein, partial [Candidatus Dojkabacteria bacterium]|nr:gluconeogenesis factor YvcK family protein [Candidatus Dojkabacteria bacterium]